MEEDGRLVTQTLVSSRPTPTAEATRGHGIAVKQGTQNCGWGSSLPATSGICEQLHARDQLEDTALWLTSADETLHGREPRGVKKSWNCPGGPVIKTLCFHFRAAWAQSLMQKLRSFMWRSQKKKFFFFFWSSVGFLYWSFPNFEVCALCCTLMT